MGIWRISRVGWEEKSRNRVGEEVGGLRVAQGGCGKYMVDHVVVRATVSLLAALGWGEDLVGQSALQAGHTQGVAMPLYVAIQLRCFAACAAYTVAAHYCLNDAHSILCGHTC